MTESAESKKRADVEESAGAHERVVSSESADPSERADTQESAATEERAAGSEGAVTSERAAVPESAETHERADEDESAGVVERATGAESADQTERAVATESAATKERPFYSLGYPHIETSSHKLWEAQQSGWPDHLPHQAWRALVYEQNREKQPVASSADHPAFKIGYAPNYLASEEGPKDEPDPQLAAKARR